VADETAELGELEDPALRAKRASEMITQHQARMAELARIRREAIDDMRAAGMSQAEIAKNLGMTRGRVAQLASAGPPPERAFFGTDALTVALGTKSEAPTKSGPSGPTVSQEGFRAYQHLKELCATLSLDAEYEFIPPPGMLRLNRDNLVVICGPRLSPLLAQVLESDPVLSFADDDDGWHIADKVTGADFRSPIDDGKPQDIGYLARLPRPDGKGTFLHIAGIHAVGSDGVVHYLSQHVSDLYSEVRTRRFSMLISCDFDPVTREIITSERLTPLLRHEGS
jgi:predicted XRE-type DNA-binding protein